MAFDATELFSLIKEKSMETPTRALVLIKSESLDIHLKSPENENYLHHIARCYHGDEDDAKLLPVVFQLSNAGIDVNCANIGGNTPLHLAAAISGGRKLIRVLLMIGADPSSQNAKGLLTRKPQNL